MVSHRESRSWVKASPRARGKALVQQDTVMKLAKAQQMERQLDRELREHLERED